MTFGLQNAAQTFQRYVDEFTRVLDFYFLYLDDFLVWSTYRSGKMCFRCAGGKIFRLPQNGTKSLPSKIQAICDFTLQRLVGSLEDS